MNQTFNARGALIASSWDYAGNPLTCCFLMHDEQEFEVRDADDLESVLRHCGRIVSIVGIKTAPNEICICSVKVD